MEHNLNVTKYLNNIISQAKGHYMNNVIQHFLNFCQTVVKMVK